MNSNSNGCDKFSTSEFNLIVDSDVDSDCTSLNEKLSTFLRIRPSDNLSLDRTPYIVHNSNQLIVKMEDKRISLFGSAKKSLANQEKIYKFTQIFDGTSGQKTIFAKCCSPLVDDLLNGTNGFLFCFGTSSSGKSHTMRGPHQEPMSDPGLIPKALKKIFTSRKFVDTPVFGKNKFNDILYLNEEQRNLTLTFKDAILSSPVCRSVSPSVSTNDDKNFNEDGYQYLCYLSYFEIYNNHTYDLLNSSDGRGQPLSWVVDEQKGNHVKDLSSVFVTSLSEAQKIYAYGWNNLVKNIQKTGLNDNSSRSHSFFNATVIKFKEDAGKLFDSQVSHLTLGDLAGEEKAENTQSEGIRFKEGTKINGSLFNLKQCFSKAKLIQKNSNKKPFIPFRECQLTKLFHPYLTGTGRVWMIININPLPNLFQETCKALDFCDTASQIPTNCKKIDKRTTNIIPQRSVFQEVPVNISSTINEFASVNPVPISTLTYTANTNNTSNNINISNAVPISSSVTIPTINNNNCIKENENQNTSDAFSEMFKAYKSLIEQTLAEHEAKNRNLIEENSNLNSIQAQMQQKLTDCEAKSQQLESTLKENADLKSKLEQALKENEEIKAQLEEANNKEKISSPLEVSISRRTSCLEPISNHNDTSYSNETFESSFDSNIKLHENNFQKVEIPHISTVFRGKKTFCNQETQTDPFQEKLEFYASKFKQVTKAHATYARVIAKVEKELDTLENPDKIKKPARKPREKTTKVTTKENQTPGKRKPLRAKNEQTRRSELFASQTYTRNLETIERVSPYMKGNHKLRSRRSVYVHTS